MLLSRSRLGPALHIAVVLAPSWRCRSPARSGVDGWGAGARRCPGCTHRLLRLHLLGGQHARAVQRPAAGLRPQPVAVVPFDGLSLLFATLITAVGDVDRRLRREVPRRTPRRRPGFTSRCSPSWGDAGRRPCDNVLMLFVFWELTGFTSYLLIGFEHEGRRRDGRRTQALTGHRRRRPRAAAAGILLVEGWRHEQSVRSARAAARPHRSSRSTPASPSWFCSPPSRSPRSSPSTSGCRTRCRRRRRSARICTPPRW